MITIKDLIDDVDFKPVCNRIDKYHKTEKMNEFELLYQHLQQLTPNENKNNMTLFIQVFQNINNDVVYFPEYNELEFEHDSKEFYFDVSGKDNLSEHIYSIVSCGYQDFLGYFIENETLQKFTKESVIAHFLWEITFFGFDNEHTL